MISYLRMKYRYIFLLGIFSIFFSIKVFNSFNYKHMSYNQNKILNDDLLNNILGLYKDSSNIDIEKISSILDQIDILNSYNIIKSIPNHIFIYFEEKIPISIIASDSIYFGLDQSGKIFDIWPLSIDDYEITTLDAYDTIDEIKLLSALEILHNLHTSDFFYKKVKNIIITNNDIILTIDSTEIIFSDVNIYNQLEKFYGFLKSDLGNSFTELEYINLSYLNQIIIKNRLLTS